MKNELNERAIFTLAGPVIGYSVGWGNRDNELVIRVRDSKFRLLATLNNARDLLIWLHSREPEKTEYWLAIRFGLPWEAVAGRNLIHFPERKQKARSGATGL